MICDHGSLLYFLLFDRPVVYNKVIDVLQKCNLIVKKFFFCKETKIKRSDNPE